MPDNLLEVGLENWMEEKYCCLECEYQQGLYKPYIYSNQMEEEENG